MTAREALTKAAEKNINKRRIRISNLLAIADDDTVNNFARAICREAAHYLSDLALRDSLPEEGQGAEDMSGPRQDFERSIYARTDAEDRVPLPSPAAQGAGSERIEFLLLNLKAQTKGETYDLVLELERACAALRAGAREPADAARYRWIRSQLAANKAITISQFPSVANLGGLMRPNEYHIDDCIDRAMLAAAPSQPREEARDAAPDAAKYARKNPLGGPASMFRVIAERLEAGEDYAAVLADYGLAHDVHRMESDLLAIAETVQPRPGQDSMDYAMIVSCIRRIFEADEEFYINLAASVRGRS